MKTTPHNGFPMPELDDFANPLQLQALAEAIDAKLAAQYTSLNALSYPDYTYQVLTANIPLASNGGVVQFLNFPFGVNGSGGSYYPSTPGMYLAMYYIASNPAGTVNLNTFRTVWLFLQDLRGPDGTVFYQETWPTEKYESNSGGEYQTGVQMFPIYGAGNGALVQLQVSHTNTGSNLRYLTGSYFFVARIGDLT